MNESQDEESRFIRQVTEPLTSPRSSFRSILEKPNLSKAATLILLIAIIAAWASYNYTGKLPLNTAPEQETTFPPGPGAIVSPEQFRQASMIVSTITEFAGVFGGWLITSALVHGFAKIQKGKSNFRKMLTLAGYASIPLLIQHLLRLLDSFIVTEQEMLQLTARIQGSTQSFLDGVANKAIETFTIFQLWTMALLVIAIHENYKISTLRSIVVAGLSYTLIIFLKVFLTLT